jgi:hypothetical protein
MTSSSRSSGVGRIVSVISSYISPKALQEAEIQIADGFHLAALDESEYEAVMLFLNHSCEPNVGFAAYRGSGMGGIVRRAARQLRLGSRRGNTVVQVR